MKRVPMIGILLLMITSLLVLTGFQCGSTEVTSAKLYISKSDWNNAEKALVKETDKAPTSGEAWYLLGNVRMNKADFNVDRAMSQSFTSEASYVDSLRLNISGMVTAYDKSIGITPEYQPRIKNEKLHAWQRLVNSGVLLYNKTVSSSRDSAKVLRSRAVDFYEMAIGIFPDSVLPYQNAAAALHADGRFDEEITYLKKARAKKPSPDISISIINYYLQKGEEARAKSNDAQAKEFFGQAITELAEARRLDPSNPELVDAMINAYIKAGRTPEAKPLMREAIARDPKNKLYHYNLGVLLMDADSLNEALNHFDNALEIDPAYQVALQNAAVTAMKLGDQTKKKAVAEAEKTKKEPNKAFVEMFKRAAGYFEKIIALKNDDPNLWEYLGSAYANAGMLKKAEEALKKADALKKK